MLSEFNITTSGIQDPVYFEDLGQSSTGGYAHPTVSYNLLLEFYDYEISTSKDIQDAIDKGYITVTDENGNSITDICCVKLVKHELAGIEHTSTGLSELNALISDATLIDTDDSRLIDRFVPMAEPTGFENIIDSEISFSDSGPDMTFTIQPTVDTFNYWIKGVRYTVSSTGIIQISNDEGLHYIYYDGEILSETTSFTDDLLLDKALISIVYWDSDNGEHIYFADERHGITMDGVTHLFIHTVFGFTWLSGLALGNMTVDGDGDSNTHAQFSIANGTVRDEDLYFSIEDGNPQDLSTVAQIPIYYKLGASGNWRMKSSDDFPIIYDGTAGYVAPNGRLPYNQWTGDTWQLTEVSNNDFVLVHYFVNNDVEHPIIGIQGENIYSNLSNAREGATTELNTLNVSGLPLVEFAPIASVIYQTGTGYANTPQARIKSTDTGGDYINWRGSGLSQSVVSGSHANLSELDYVSSGHTDFQRSAYITTSDPTADNDDIDTAALGRIFNAGDVWINSDDENTFICKDATTGAAIWRKFAKGSKDIHIDMGNTGISVCNTSDLRWNRVRSLIFRGTDVVGIPTSVKFITSAVAGETGDIRLRDVVNNLTIAQINAFGETRTIQTDSSLVNLPTDETIFEIQMQSNGGSLVRCSHVVICFD